jgi:hypothetical protein
MEEIRDTNAIASTMLNAANADTPGYRVKEWGMGNREWEMGMGHKE